MSGPLIASLALAFAPLVWLIVFLLHIRKIKRDARMRRENMERDFAEAVQATRMGRP